MKNLYLSILTVSLLSVNVQAFSLSDVASAASSTLGSSSSSSKSSSLIDTLTSSLGVTPTQAAGGATAILTDAATKMSKEDVNSLSSKIPGIASMLGGDSDSTGGLGGMASSLLGSSSLKSQFEALGMDSSMIDKFTPVILNFINSEAGSSLMKSVKSALLG